MMKAATYLALLAIPFVLSNLSAQDGALDFSFGQQGIVLTELPDVVKSYSKSILSLEDGKTILIGNATYGTNEAISDPYDIYMIQYHENGSLDTDFGTEGTVRITLSSEVDIVRSATLQEDGKIVLTGFFTKRIKENGEADTDVFVARYLSDGTPDGNFGENGVASISIASGGDIPATVLIQPDDKILVGGYYYNGRNAEAFLLRFLPDGSRDTSFGDFGKVVLRDDGVSIHGMMLQSDGKIVIAGNYIVRAERADLLLRFLSDGQLDTSFANQGVLKITVAEPDAYLVDQVQLPDDGFIGLINYFSFTTGNHASSFAIIRLDKEGNLVDEFGANGMRSYSAIYPSMDAIDLLRQADGKLLLSGSSKQQGMTGEAATIIRLLPDGEPDTDFGLNGLITHFALSDYEEGQVVHLQEDGKILLAGRAFTNTPTAFKAYLLRLDNQKPVNTVNKALEITGLQVFPNPASESVNINFQLLQAQVLSLQLYDLQGRLIAPLIENERLPAGNHQRHFMLPNGVTPGNYVLLFSTKQEQMGLKILIGER